MTERKYALVRIRKGDYLLPSNDRTILWRIHSYEDGPSHGLEEWSRDRTLWMIRKWYKPLTDEMLAHFPPDPDDWDQWEAWDSSFTTRSEAIRAALRAN